MSGRGWASGARCAGGIPSVPSNLSDMTYRDIDTGDGVLAERGVRAARRHARVDPPGTRCGEDDGVKTTRDRPSGAGGTNGAAHAPAAVASMKGMEIRGGG